ncbi:A24 family peptidase [Shigella flexneri]|uniref:A24 family peptidase n=1 Tax=Shigella flexneri TaxID=623 RepID=UPI000AF206A8
MDTTLPFLILYACLSALLFFWDAKHGLLPDRFTCPLLWSGLLFYQVCHPDGLADALWGQLLVTAHSLSFTGGIAYCDIKKD